MTDNIWFIAIVILGLSCTMIGYLGPYIIKGLM